MHLHIEFAWGLQVAAGTLFTPLFPAFEEKSDQTLGHCRGHIAKVWDICKAKNAPSNERLQQLSHLVYESIPMVLTWCWWQWEQRRMQIDQSSGLSKGQWNPQLFLQKATIEPSVEEHVHILCLEVSFVDTADIDSKRLPLDHTREGKTTSVMPIAPLCTWGVHFAADVSTQQAQLALCAHFQTSLGHKLFTICSNCEHLQ
jgi:hypothetical protein